MSSLVSLYQQVKYDYFFKQKNDNSQSINSFHGKNGLYKIVKTKDNTLSLWSEKYNQLCHSNNGAHKETLHNFISHVNIPQPGESLNILEIGFGTGMGLLSLLDWFKKNNNAINTINFYSIEQDKSLIDLFLKLCNLNSFSSTITKYLKNFSKYEDKDFLIYENNNAKINIKIINSDAIKFFKLNNLNVRFTNIFHDAFSPDVNAELWSKDFFNILHSLSNKEMCTLSTYSSARKVRENLINAGWNIHDAKGFGAKRNMTLATTHRMMDLNIIKKYKIL
jgi:tRNA U34 5-methylaminomethyl-2-thiouridine-forming methyltransferase MnmC